MLDGHREEPRGPNKLTHDERRRDWYPFREGARQYCTLFGEPSVKQSQRKPVRLRHVLDRYGLWTHVRRGPQPDELGPKANIGLIQMAAWGENARSRRFIRKASRQELATYISLLAAIGEDVAALPLRDLFSIVRKIPKEVGVIGVMTSTPVAEETFGTPLA
jgi:hypothetical protein